MRRLVSVSIVLLPALLATALFARGIGELVALIAFPPRVATVEPMVVPPPAADPPGRAIVTAEKAAAPSASGGPCSLGSRVVALVTDDAHPETSLAVVTWPGATGFDRPVIRAGSSLGGRRVAAITSSRVWLRDGARMCFLDGTTEKVAQATVAAKGIESVDDTHVRVDRSVRDALIEKGPMALGSVRIVPEMAFGKVVGMKLTSVDANGALGKLGLRAGDSLVSINGFDLTTPEGALEAFARLRGAPTLEVTLRRNGKPTSLRVDVI